MDRREFLKGAISVAALLAAPHAAACPLPAGLPPQPRLFGLSVAVSETSLANVDVVQSLLRQELADALAYGGWVADLSSEEFLIVAPGRSPGDPLPHPGYVGYKVWATRRPI